MKRVFIFPFPDRNSRRVSGCLALPLFSGKVSAIDALRSRYERGKVSLLCWLGMKHGICTGIRMNNGELDIWAMTIGGGNVTY